MEKSFSNLRVTNLQGFFDDHAKANCQDGAFQILAILEEKIKKSDTALPTEVGFHYAPKKVFAFSLSEIFEKDGSVFVVYQYFGIAS